MSDIQLEKNSANVTEALARLKKVECYIKDAEMITPLELTRYYTKFKQVADYSGPSIPQPAILRELWIRGINPPHFRKLVEQNRGEIQNLADTFEQAITLCDALCDESHKITTLTKYFAPPEAKLKNKYMRNNRKEEDANKKRNFSDTRKENVVYQDKAKSYLKGDSQETEFDNDRAKSSRIDDRREWSDKNKTTSSSGANANANATPNEEEAKCQSVLRQLILH